MPQAFKDQLKSQYMIRVCSNIVHTDPLPRGSVASGFTATTNKGGGSTGHSRGKSLKGRRGWRDIKAFYEREDSQ